MPEIKLTKVSFDLLGDDKFIVTVQYESNEPGSDLWPGGIKEKAFPNENALDYILRTEIANANFLTW